MERAGRARGCCKARPGLDGRIRRSWTRRSDAFGQVRREELQSDKSSLWRAEILPWLPRQGRRDRPARVNGARARDFLPSCWHRRAARSRASI